MRTRMKSKVLAIVLSALLIASMMPVLATAASADYFTLLLLGTDQIGKEITGNEELGRSDAIVIASLNLKTGSVKMVSIDRDYLVELPDGMGANKLCTATFFGGPQLTLKLVNQLFSLDIPYYASVDFSGMQMIVDSLNGIEIDVLEEELDISLYGSHAKAFKQSGLQTIDGKQAVSYMKNRTVDDDIHRNARQRKVLTACLNKGMRLGIEDMMDLTTEAVAYVRTNMTLNDMMNTAFTVLSVQFAGTEEMRSPIAGHSEFVNLHNVVVADDLQAETAQIHQFLFGLD